MNTLFISSLLATIALARLRPQSVSWENNDLDLLSYASVYGKSYKSVTEMTKRSANLQKSKASRVQLRKDNPDAIFGDTYFSDLSDEEKAQWFGFNFEEGRRLDEEDEFPLDDRRQLAPLVNKDWVAEHKMGPVKNQRSCGSCAAFNTTSVLEAMKMIKDNNFWYVRLSEQQALDCSRSYGNRGCSGGWMHYYFRFSQDKGSMAYSDYPSQYTASDESCKQVASSIISVRADYSNTYKRLRNPSVVDIFDHLLQGPLSIGLNASGWSSEYRGGIMSASNLSCDPGRLNHAVVLVGYQEPVYTTRQVRIEEPAKDMFIDPTKLLCSNGTEMTPLGCVYEYKTVYTLVSPGAWKIQNSWGSNWGENGFIRFKAVGGSGVCGMNTHVEFVNVQ